MSKPKFDPNKPFSVADSKPKFDPNKSFEVVKEPDISELDSAARGAAQGLTFGLADEAVGAANNPVGALKEIANKFGADFSDEDIEEYKRQRDESRKNFEAAQKANPMSYGAGEIGGGIATAFIPGVGAIGAAGKAATLGGKVAAGAAAGLRQGAITGLGMSNEESLGGIAKDTAIGAGAGAVVGGAIPVVGAGIKKAIEAAPRVGSKVVDGGRVVKDFGKSVANDFKQGIAEQNVTDLPVIKQLEQVYGGTKGVVQGAKNTKQLSNEIRQLKIDKFIDNNLENGTGEDFALDLFEAGPSPTKEWVASKASTLAPGQVDSKAAQELLEMGAERRIRARNFDNKVAAQEVTGLVDETGDVFNKAKRDIFAAGQQKAARQFNPKDGDSVVASLSTLKGQASTLKSIPGRTRNVLDDIETVLVKGEAPEDFGLTAGSWSEAAGPERFTRLQRARELLQSEIEYNKANKIEAGERILRQAETKIDNALKSVPEKVKADKMYSRMTEIENKLFKATEFRNAAGKTDVDEFKIGKLFNDNDTAGRFKNTLREAEDFLKEVEVSEALDSNTKSQMEELILKFKLLTGTAEDKRKIVSAGFSSGPTSPAVERISSILNKNGLPSGAVTSPAGFMNSFDQFVQVYSPKAFDKSFGSLDQTQKTKLLRAFTWNQKNPLANQTEQERVFKKIFSGEK